MQIGELSRAKETELKVVEEERVKLKEENDVLMANLDTAKVESLRNYHNGGRWTTDSKRHGSCIADIDALIDSSLADSISKAIKALQAQHKINIPCLQSDLAKGRERGGGVKKTIDNQAKQNTSNQKHVVAVDFSCLYFLSH